MFGSILAILYRNFWLSYKANISSLSFIICGCIFMFLWNFRYSRLYPVLIYLLHLQQISINTYSMVDDRSSNFKAIFRFMGLKHNQYISGQMISFVVQGLLINVLMYAFAMLLNYLGHYEVIDGYEVYFFIIAFVFLIQICAFSMVLSFAFKTSLLAKDIAFGINFLLIYFTFFSCFEYHFFLVDLLSPYSGITQFILGYSTYSDSSPFKNVPFMAIQAFGYFVLAILLENVYPDSEGSEKRPLFFLDCLRKKKRPVVGSNLTNPILEENIMNDTEQRKSGLFVSGLSKTFGAFKALTNVNVGFEEGKMHCLLGHNGAGKTTFINILTGVLQATQGSIFYNGQDFQELDKGKSGSLRIGLCPANDILFPDLTVYQHLKMACLMREFLEIETRISAVIQQMNLSEFSGYKVRELSGGNKRKLTIALALIGEPNLIFLDEPTSSLDPASRKDVWEILSTIKASNPNVITLLTTHHLEEAETLADNIVVLHQGTVKVSGSIQEIKKAFGVGYVIEVISDHPVPSSVFEEYLAQVNGSIEQDLQLVQTKIQDTKIEIEIKIAQAKHVAVILCALRGLIPPGMYLTINSNTLEKAYVEIDRQLHKQAGTSQELAAEEFLTNLYTGKQASGLETIWIIIKNKWLLLLNSTIEFFKLVAHYVILVSTAGIGIYLIRRDNRTVNASDLFWYYGFMVFLEVMMSSFSVYNLVYENAKGLKLLIFANKVSPLTYYIGKILADFSFVTVGYAFIYVMIRILIADELKNSEDLGVCLQNLTIQVYCWRLTYSCVGLVYQKAFISAKSALLFYNAFYVFIYLLIWLATCIFCTSVRYFSDFYLIILLLADEISMSNGLLCLAAIGVTHFLLAVYLESKALRYNFLNSPTKRANSVPKNSLLMDHNAHDIHMELHKSVIKEERETLSFEPKQLKIIDLKKKYKKKVALNEVTFSMDTGVQFGLIGPNGAGKSTLFNILLGNTLKTGGTILPGYMKEYSNSFESLFDQSPYANCQYGVCHQNDSLWDEIKVKNNLNYFAQLHNVNQASLKILLKYFEFDGNLEKHVNELSSGNKRKLSIIISLMINPNFLLYDEATSGVDLNTRLKLRGIFEFFAKHNKSMAIFTTHFLKDVDIFCNKIGVIDHGSFLCIDYLDNIKKNLGGYCLQMQVHEMASKVTVVQQLKRHAHIRIVNENEDGRTMKCLLSKIADVADLFEGLLAMEANGTLVSFSLNQLSIEDIYLDIFNRSE